MVLIASWHASIDLNSARALMWVRWVSFRKELTVNRYRGLNELRVIAAKVNRVMIAAKHQYFLPIFSSLLWFIFIIHERAIKNPPERVFGLAADYR